MSELRTQLTTQFAKSVGGATGFASRQANAARGARGDTLIEVMLATTLIMVALGGGYSLSAHSLGNALRAQQRSQALNLAQSQVEFIKAAAIKNPATFAGNYQISAAYCIETTGKIKKDGLDAKGLCSPYPGISSPVNYKIGVKYTSSSGVFNVTAEWQNANETGEVNTLQLNYRLPS